jgi:hypothetical protein
MTLFETTSGGIRPITIGSFIADGIRERQDLQRWIRDCPDSLGEKLLVISEEFGSWEDSHRRIDLLAIDPLGNLVVIELKRTDDGGFQDLQAIRYAAMISAMTFEDVVAAHEGYLRRRGVERSGREAVLQFLDSTDAESIEISSVPRIILVARDFSLEITTTVLWLVERGLDVRCVQVIPYKLQERLLLDFRQVLPLEEASEYQVKIRKKDEQLRRQTGARARREQTLHVLTRHNKIGADTQIEVVPAARPVNWSKGDQKIFRARIGDLTRRESLVWEHDATAYSPTQLTRHLAANHGLVWLANNIFIHWRICGDDESMWNRAEELTRGERLFHTDEVAATENDAR